MSPRSQKLIPIDKLGGASSPPIPARSQSDTPDDEGQQFCYLAAILFVALFIVMLKSAWLGDDYYIGLRAFDNWLNGYGLRWNPSERVQVFTDPLWMFIVAAFYAATHEAFITTMLLSIAVSLASVVLITRRVANSWPAAVAGLAALLSSKSFIDYTTSGLENALSYLLVGFFALLIHRNHATRKTFRQFVFILALVGFNRLDLMLLLLPAVAYHGWQLRSTSLRLSDLIKDCAIYSFPLSGWLIFSTVYYGYPFPNTYYAKLHTGIPLWEHVKQGILYSFNSLNCDPITLLVIASSILAIVRARDLRFMACAVGVLLYLFYIVKIGGDFMSGRFFSVPFFFCVSLLIQFQLRPAIWIYLATGFLGLGLLAPKPTLLNDVNYGSDRPMAFSPGVMNSIIDRYGIADERAVYFPHVGLISTLTHDNLKPTHGWAQQGLEARAKGPQLVVFGTPGMYGFYAGPQVHILDYHGLGDPLLSKLPIARSSNSWRVGHYARSLPEGYIETLQHGRNLITNPALHKLYQATKLLAHDRIWSGKRLLEIAKMNLGFHKNEIRESSLEIGGEPPGPAVSYPWLRKDNAR